MTIQEKFFQLTWNRRLEILRRINNWSQERAGKECSTTQKMYWLWEHARNYPTKTSRRAIARAYHMSESDIFIESRF